MTSKKTQVFGPTTWVKGDRGLMRTHTTDMPKLINMRVHPNGYLGPRPRWLMSSVALTLASYSGVETFGADFHIGSSSVQAEQANSGFVVIKNGVVEFHKLDGTLFAEEAGVSTTPIVLLTTIPQYVDNETVIYGGNVITLGVEGSNIVPYIRNADASAAANTAFFSGSGTTRFSLGVAHQGRAFYIGYHSSSETIQDPEGSGGGEATTVYAHKNRLWYSDPYDYATFTNDSQFIDFPFEIFGVFSIGASLFIWGPYGDWFMLQGRGDPASGTLNYLGRQSRPAGRRYPVLHNNIAYFMSHDHKRMVSFDEGGNFDTTSLAHLGLRDEGKVPLDGSGDAVMWADSILDTILVRGQSNDSTHRHYQNGVWTEEDWTGFSNDYDSTAGRYSTIPTDGYELLTVTDQVTGITLDAFFRPTYLDHLAQTPSGETEAETDMVGTVKLPLIVDPQQTLRINRVLVDIEGERQTGEASPTMTLTIERQDGTTLDLTIGPESDQLTFTEGGGRERRRLQFEPSEMDRFTPRAEIILTDIRRLAIEQVTVEYEIGTTELS